MRISFDDEYEKLLPTSVRGADKNRYCLFVDSAGENHEPTIIDAHWHEWLEIIYVIEGVMVLECENEFIEVNSGEVAVVGSQTLHKIKGEKGTYRFQCLHINNGLIIQNANIDIFLNHIHKIKNLKVFLEYFSKVISLMHREEVASMIKYKAYVLLLLSICMDESNESHNRNAVYSDSFTQMLFFINTKYKEQLSLKELSKKYDYTPQYISYLFNKYLGATFHTYLTKIRLDRAKFMLHSTEEKIINIAYECGFPSEHSFIAQFKKVYGMTPLNYKKQMKKNSE